MQALAQHLRLCIQAKRLSLRAVERELGMGVGYLGQLIGGNVDLKLKHLIAVLDVLAIEPEEFFTSFYRGTLPADVSYAPAPGSMRFDFGGAPDRWPGEVVPGVSEARLERAVQQCLLRMGYAPSPDSAREEQSLHGPRGRSKKRR